MRRAGRLVAMALDLAAGLVAPGTTTGEIDRRIENLIRKGNGRPAFKGYRGFPASACISIDEQVVHGIPGKRKLEEGQICGIDVGVELDGYFADAAKTFAVGRVSEEARRLMDTGETALEACIAHMRVGERLFDISGAVEEVAVGAGFSVVRDYVGHGIGKRMHEEPQIPNYKQPGRGPKLLNGMVFALEPMINAGGFEVEVLDDEWTVVTKDRALSVHYEHTVAITIEGPEVLTVL